MNYLITKLIDMTHKVTKVLWVCKEKKWVRDRDSGIIGCLSPTLSSMEYLVEY